MVSISKEKYRRALSKNRAEATALALALAMAYPVREYTSSAVYTYFLIPSGPKKWMVSICTKAPGWSASGRGGYFRVLAHALLRFSGAQYVPTIRLTEESETMTPSFFKSACTTMAQRRTSSRLAMTRARNSAESARGDFFGIGRRVSTHFR